MTIRTVTSTVSVLSLAAVAGLVSVISSSATAQAEEAIENLLLDATPTLNVRTRYEHVDQDGKSDHANAKTVRTRLGLESGRFHGVGVVFDYEWIESLGSERYNSTTNGKTNYPVVADPEDDEVNQLYLVATGTIPNTNLKLGRQRVIWDNSRFIGNVGFRQNEQTFDAFRGVVTPMKELDFEYLYLDQANRIFGRDSSNGRAEMSSHGFRMQYRGWDNMSVTPFALLLDYDKTAQSGSSSATYGVMLNGKLPLDNGKTFLYNTAFAYQEDYGDNPDDFDAYYLQLEPGIKMGGLTLFGGYELLSGDGEASFQTPLATLHKFNGFTDTFLTTPPDGLQDAYLKVGYKVAGEAWYSGIKLGAQLHGFWADETSDHYGTEWNLAINKGFSFALGKLVVGLKYASYDAEDYGSDTDKLWLSTQFSLHPRKLRDLSN